VHKKSQENFERITMRRLIQIQDGHPETVEIWLAFIRKHAYYGVGMKANVWEHEKLGKISGSLKSQWHWLIKLARGGQDHGRESREPQENPRAQMGAFRTAEEHGYVREGVPDDGERCLPADFGRALESSLIKFENIRAFISSRCYTSQPAVVISFLLLS